jgi:hypothetical protein
MTLLDWCILWAPVTAVTAIALITTKYDRSVVDFLAAGRYLLATAKRDVRDDGMVGPGHP